MTLAPGTRLGPYEILSAIGAGGMGEVYRARDARLGRDVALKVLLAPTAADPDRLRRFEQEARTTAALNHPNIVAVFDVGTDAGVGFVVSELLEGETLRDRLTTGAIPLRKAIEWGGQLTRGLAAAHETGDHWDAAESFRMGVTQQVAATPAAALEAGIAIARKIAACAPLSVKATLASAHQVVDPVEADALSKLGAQYSALYRTEDFIEGRRAEAEGRAPRYQGK